MSESVKRCEATVIRGGALGHCYLGAEPGAKFCKRHNAEPTIRHRLVLELSEDEAMRLMDFAGIQGRPEANRKELAAFVRRCIFGSKA